jgi:tagaturonate reductase
MPQKLNRITASAQSRRPVKVLQFGKGNFLRAFADWMIDIMNDKTDFNGSVQIVQVNSKETDTRFRQQDGLYHTVINGYKGGAPMRETRLITCVRDVINPLEDFSTYLRAGENPDLRFVISNTTEAGIEFDPDDLRPDVPQKSFPGKLTALLYHRYKFFKGAPEKTLTVLPCELVERNGEALRKAVSSYIRHWDLEPGFMTWILDHTLFCNTLVDRIVPGFPKTDAHTIWNETGFEDDLVVSAEPYYVWVIEPIEIPGFQMEHLKAALPFEQAGLEVLFVSDLTPYRIRKVRILNGAHTAMVPVAYLRGLRTVKDALEDSFTGDFIRRAIQEEIMPVINMPHGELQRFATDVIERFQNPYIKHELKSIALNSISKFQVRILPTLLEYVALRDELPVRLVHALAALILFYRGTWRGESLPVNDSPWIVSFFKAAWTSNDATLVTHQVLSNAELWKTDLTQVNGLAEAVEKNLRQLMDGERH